MIAIIDYRAGNLKSVQRALKHLGLACRITDSAQEILAAERVIFPGVGAAGQAMETIRAHGLNEAIHAVIEQGTPFMGICLGTQIILEKSEEDGGTDCLGVIPGTVRRFAEMGLKIPHMGWNSLSPRTNHPLLAGVNPQAQFYFVHSYYPDPREADKIAATTTYGITFASVLASGNVFATQFHPEKSGEPGLKILENFSRWDGRG
ncbi:MAG: imidazole glycerol phosphate synthase subunit HisH [Syntrophaceae bacterium]